MSTNPKPPPQASPPVRTGGLADLEAKKRQLLALLLKEEGIEPLRSPILPLPRDLTFYPLSYEQERLWVIDQIEPGNTAYNLPLNLLLTGPLRLDVLARAFGEVVRRHFTLRTTYGTGPGGTPVQVVAPLPAPQALPALPATAPVPIPLIDLEGLPPDSRDAEQRRITAAEAILPFDLARGPVLRVWLLRLLQLPRGAEHALLVTVHHIATDGWSNGVLLRELTELYGALLEGRPSRLPELPIQYVDFADWQRRIVRGEVIEKALGYWRRQLAASRVLDLPTDRPRPLVQGTAGGAEAASLPDDVVASLKGRLQEEGVTLFMLLTAAWQALLFRHAGQSDFSDSSDFSDFNVGTPVANRYRAELEPLIGFFVNTLVIRADLSGDPPFRELLGRVKKTVVDAFAHQQVPFSQVVEAVKPERSLAHTPLFQVMISLLHAATYGLEAPRPGDRAAGKANGAGNDARDAGLLGFVPLGTRRETAMFDLHLSLVESSHGVAASLEYRADLFDRSTARRILEHFAELLRGAVADPGLRVSELPLLTAPERAQILAEWNDTGRDWQRDRCLHELVEEQAARAPDAMAFEHRGELLTYGELMERSGHLAGRLRELGVGPESRVGVCLTRTLDLPVALLGVLRAGGAYVPLDPAYPEERLRYLLEDSRAAVLITREDLQDRLSETGIPRLVIENGELRVPPPRAGGLPLPQNLAYLIYTSGSTGRPKGVAIEHRSAVTLVRWAAEAFPRDAFGALLAPTSINFDVSIFELFVTLCLGGRVVLLEDALRLAGIESERAGLPPPTSISTVPSAMAELLRSGNVPAAPRTVCLGGEPLHRRLVEGVHAALPEAVVWNLYGPTEDTTFSTVSRYAAGFEGPVHIGRPLAATRVYLLDPAGQLVPQGVPGELCLAGEGLSRGYLDGPGLTAERFVPDAVSEEPGARLYRTGDLARWRATGELEYLGRLDHQVKVRGFRVELGEIEAALGAHPAVLDCAVIAREGEAGKFLAAFVVPAGEPVPAPAGLRAWLQGRLPEHLVPTSWTTLEALPLTSNGKVDRRALAALGPGSADSAETGPDGPRTQEEELLAGIWARLLGVPRVGVHDNFFELGGHSLLATRVVAQVREVFRVEIPQRALFESPTVAGLAAEVQAARRLEGGDGGWSVPPVERESAPDAGPPPLSFSQERLWLIDQLEPGSNAYNIPVALRLAGGLNRRALAAAFTGVVRRHEVLRTTFGTVPHASDPERAVPVQVIHPAESVGDFPLPLADLACLPEEVRDAEVRRLSREEGRRAFDLLHGPVLRALLVREDDSRHALLVTVHHIASDGWSNGILVREIVALYEAAAAGRPSPLPPLPLGYSDFARWQRRTFQSEALESVLDYWRRQLAGVPVLELPADRPRPAVQGPGGAREGLWIPREILDGLRRLGRREGATLFMAVLAGFQALLARITGQADLALGTPVAGRRSVDLEGLIGFFVNTLVVRGDLSGDPPVRALLARTRETSLEAFAHQEVPFEKLVEEINPERTFAHSPLFQAMLVLQNTPAVALETSGLSFEPLETGVTAAKFDLSLELHETPHGLGGMLEYRPDLFDRTTVQRLLEHLEILLAGMVTDPSRRLSELPLLAKAEAQALLAEWSDVARPAPPSLDDRLRNWSRRTPEAPAVVFEGRTLSYAEVDSAVTALAERLRNLGVGPDVQVGICAERSPEMVVAVLAVLWAGGAYVPIDPAYPAERIALLLQESAAPVLLTQERLVASLPAFRGDVVLLDHPHPVILSEAKDLGGGVVPSPENLAYVIYTSGSTGRPKGVGMSRGALANLLAWQEGFLPEPARTLQLASLSFDVSFQEIASTVWTGGALVLVSEETRRDPQALLDLLEAERVERLFLPLVALRQLAQEAVAGAKARSLALRDVVTAGEQLQVTPAVAAWFAGLPGCRLHNHYGPTETHVATALVLDGPPRRWPALPAIGRPIANVPVRLLDAALRPVPVGSAGELCAGGAAPARGYLGRPDWTAERFVPDPWATSGERLYRTGDLARWRADGLLEYLGRRDGQVKVRGIRVELGEVEVALQLHPGVRQAVVVAAPGPQATDTAVRLVAFFLADPAAPAASDDLRDFLRQRLPAPFVPSVLMPLDSFPLTPSGKVDRRALARLQPELAGEGGRFVAPRTLTEERLAEIWERLLGRPQVGVEDSFFDLGGHSLLATQVVSRIREAFQIELPQRALFEEPTVAGLAARIETALREVADGAPPLDLTSLAAETGPLRLSFAQERLWVLDQLEPGSNAYNIPVALRLLGSLDPAALQTAFTEIVRRHETLRTTFAVLPTEEGSFPVQVVHPAAAVPVPRADLSALPLDWRDAEARRLSQEEGGRPFDLTHGPILRVLLVRLTDDAHALFVTVHHIASDGWSSGVLVREMTALYEAFSRGEVSSWRPLPPLPVRYADYARWQRRVLEGEALERMLGYWRRQLAGVPVLELPTDRPRPPVQQPGGATVGVFLPRDLADELRALGNKRQQRQPATLFMVLLAGFQALLSRITGQTDIPVGTPVAGRRRVELEGLIGFFVNTLVIRGDLSGDPTAAELIARARSTALEAFAHQDVPFEKLVEELNPERSFAHSPLFQAMLVLLNAPLGRLEAPGLAFEPFETGTITSKFDLNLALTETEEGVIGALEYRPDLFDRTTVQRRVKELLVLLHGMLAEPERRLSELPLLTEGERHALLFEGNDTSAPDGTELPLERLLAERVARTPDAPAVSFEGRVFTYAEMAAAAGRLKRRLRDLGIGPDVPVGICAERSPEMVVAVLAVLAAGGAYVPLDPTYPAERLAWMLEDSAVPVLLTQERLLRSLQSLSSFGCEVVLLDAPTPFDEPSHPVIRSEAKDLGGGAAAPENLAYILYTSGSTGQPKGVALSRGALTNLLAWQRQDSVPYPARTLQFASLAFDASYQEIVSTWIDGGTVVLVSEETRRDPRALLDLLERERVERMFLPFVALRQLAEAAEGRPGPVSLRDVLTAGEALQLTRPVTAWFESTGARLHNYYGPTETHVVTALDLGPDPARWPETWSALPPIGRPIANTQIYVLDGDLRPVPLGVDGELWIGGVSLARGYLGRPGLTAERFAPDPWSPVPGGRLYRTGDRARLRADGRIEFLGRRDDQVKIRGVRVEPGEIEAVLDGHPEVRKAVVVAGQEPGGALRLVAFYIPENLAASPAELRDFLREKLPPPLVPSVPRPLDSFPLTPSGKVDRRALAALDPEGPEERDSEAPRNQEEELLAGIWAGLLGVPRVGLHDNFFDLGGHSLLATRVVSRIREVFRTEIPQRALFEAPTVAGLAARIQAEKRLEGGWIVPPIEPSSESAPPPLSFSQERLWLIDQLEPGNNAYNMPFALRLAGALDRSALRTAFTELIRRHEPLRTTFATVPAGDRGDRGERAVPVQVAHPASSFPLPLADLSGLPEEARSAETRRLSQEEGTRPFDLAHGPVIRVLPVTLDPGEHALFVTVHHIACDGWSNGILVQEIVALYEAFAAGCPSPLARLPIRYADYARWQRRTFQGESLQAVLDYWRQRLAGVPVLELPTDRPRPPVQGPGGARQPVWIPRETADGLSVLGRREGATLFMVCMATFQALLGRISGQSDVPVGTPVAGRRFVELEGLIGFFTNTLVLRGDLGGDPTTRELLGRTREASLEAFAHQDVPFEKLVEEINPDRTFAHAPLFQVMLVLQNNPAGVLETPGLSFKPLEGGVTTAKFDLTLALGETPAGLGGELEYRPDLFDRATIQRLLQHFRILLAALVEDPSRRLLDLPLLTEPEFHAVLAEWNDTALPAGLALEERLTFYARQSPDAPAVVFEGRTYSYGEMDAAVARLSGRLVALGVGPDVQVGICAERSPEMVAAVLAVLRAGGAYVPIDPAYPAERIALLLEESEAPVLLTQERLAPTLPPYRGEVVLLDAPDPVTLGEAKDLGGGAPVPENLAYVIYTSGSAGRPKGVALSRGALANLLAWHDGVLPRPARTLQFASLSFDVSFQEIASTFGTGGTLVLVSEEVRRDPPSLLDLLEAERVERLFIPFVVLRQLAEEAMAGKGGGRPRSLALRDVVAAGEQLQVTPAVAAWFESLPGCRLHNHYGPTETHVVTALVLDGDPRSWPALPTVGRPIGNVAVRLLDPALRPVPVGSVGELCLAGAALARGYLGRPDWTAERFVPDPWDLPGDRLYRTGDLARWRADGLLELLGRRDGQVKIRGVRVETGEVEAALQLHSGVRQAVVLAAPGLPGSGDVLRLLAFFLPDPAKPPTAEELRDHLRRRLPAASVPAAYVPLDAFPLTPSGKVDRRALLKIQPENAGDEKLLAPPRTPTEELLATIWAGLLGVPQVGVDDSFFDLGGHSLLATQVVSRVREVFRVDLPQRALFEELTVERLAARLERERGRETGRETVSVRPPLVAVPRDGRSFPASHAQQPLWAFDRVHPGDPQYNLAAWVPLPADLRPAVLATCFAEIVRRHEALRTTFADRAGEAVQVIHPPAPVPLPEVDLSVLATLSTLPGSIQAAETARIYRSEALRPYDLQTGPLLRLLLLRTGDAFALLVGLHHIVGDGWSLQVLRRDLEALYPALAQGRPSPLPELPVQYADFAVWQRAWLAGDGLERELEPWRRALAGAPALLELPLDRPRPLVRRFRGGNVPVALPAGLSQAVPDLARRASATPFLVLLAAFQALLARISGQTDVVAGGPVANRTQVATEGVAGFFVNQLALRTRLDGDPAFGEIVERVRETALDAYAHQDLPFEKLVEELIPRRSLAHAPVFQVVLSYQQPWLGLASPGFAGSAAASPVAVSRFDLMLVLHAGGERLIGELTYDADLFDRTTAVRLAERFELLLRDAVESPGRQLSELALLTAPERAQVLVEWNDTARAGAPALRVHDLIAEHAERTPDAPAVELRGEVMPYWELHDRAELLAAALQGLGVGPEVRVGVCLPRTLDLPLALLGVLRAGGAYVPLDPEYPEERLRFLLEDSGAAVVVTQERLLGHLPDTRARRLFLDGGEVRLTLPFSRGPAGSAAPVQPGNLAYLIYTSGSTGKPKGVAVEHRSAVALARWAAEAFPRDHFDAVLAAGSVSFDVTVFELLVTLCLGGKLVLVDDILALSSAGTLKGGPTLVAAVPSAMAELLRRDSLPATIKSVALGGEALPRWLADEVQARLPEAAVWNLYGPTESTVYATRHRVGSGSSGPPIGRPVAGTRALVLDQGFQPVPPGVTGELYLAGAGLARGYLDRPALTAERFLPDPFGEPGSRLYRTGDLARWRASGVLDHLGRTDQQVKVRGFRIELGEVEAVLGSHPGVQGCAVLVTGEGDARALRAYVAMEGDTSLADLRDWLRERLPEPLVPSSWVTLDALPLTPSGKVDRRALAAREDPGGVALSPSAPPEGRVEETIAGVLAAVLGLPGLPGRHDGFFNLGGHSLLVTQAVSRLNGAFGLALPPDLLYDAQTVAALAARIEEARQADGGAPGVPPLVPVPRDGRALPLSFAQQRLWFLDRLEPGSPLYNLPVVFPLGGSLRVDVLAASFSEIVRRHEVLRTVFPDRGGRNGPDDGPVQEVLPPAPVPLPVIDLSALPDGRRMDEARLLAAAESLRPFDLARGPLLRVGLLRLDTLEHLLLTVQHHIVSDGWSQSVFLREMDALYEAFAQGLPSPLPELPLQYADFAVWQRAWLQGPLLEAEIEHWRRRLAGAPALLELPADRPRPAVRGTRGGAVPVLLPDDLAAAVTALARRSGATVFMTLLAALQALLARLAGQDDVSVGTPIANRNRPEIEGLIGFLVNTLVLRGDISGDPPFASWLEQVRQTALDAYAHPDLPFEKLVEVLEPGRSLAHSALFQVMFAFQRPWLGELSSEVESAPLLTQPPPSQGGGTQPPGEPAGLSKFDLTLNLEEGSGQMAGAFVYRADLFDRVTIERLRDRFERLLRAAVADPGAALSQLPLLSEAERHQALIEWNDSATPAAPAAEDLCLHEIFLRQAARTPGALAVVFEGKVLTYGELARRSQRLARRLAVRGVGSETRVALCADRRPEMIIGLLGILQAGAAYVPLDPAAPAQRLAALLADTGAPVVLTMRRFLERIPRERGREVLPLDDIEEEGSETQMLLPRGGMRGAATSPENAAYVIYTSGSTGTPKGVVVEHRQALAYVRGVERRLGLPPGASFAMVQPLTVDSCKTVIFPSLLRGGLLHLISEERALDPRGLAEALRNARVDVLKIAPSHLSALQSGTDAAGMAADLLPGGWLVFGGEASRIDWARDLARAGSCRVFNHYGPTETTVGVLVCPVEPGLGAGPSLTTPLGRPLPGVQAYVVDPAHSANTPVPLGVAGDLLLGGSYVARGYLGRPDLTAERFVPDPFGEAPGGRLYRTGDRVRFLADGKIEFLGRLDQQVKIRGFRIELGEVEAALGRHPAVAEGTVAAIAARPDANASLRLVGYVVPRQAAGARPSPESLQAFLRERLPEPMVPAAWVFLAELPRTPHGKLDRKALPDPAVPSGGTLREGPRNATEELLAEVWKDLLGLSRVGVGEDFFALGGHSLLATQVASRVRQAFGIDLPVRAVFEEPTLAGLAGWIERERRGRAGGDPHTPAAPPLVPAPRGGRDSRPLPLSFGQQRLWFLDRLAPGTPLYNVPFALPLAAETRREVLAASFGEIVRRHEVLRTTFPEREGEPFQEIHPVIASGRWPLPLVDLTALPEAARGTEARRLTEAAAREPFDLARGPLLRVRLLRLEAGEGPGHLLVGALHHIVSDGWSRTVFRREIEALYAAFAEGRPSPLPELPVQYADVAVWQRRWLQGEVLELEVEHWRQALAGVPPVLELPADHPRPAVRSQRGADLPVRLAEGLAAGVRALSRQAGATVFMTLLAALQALLGRLSGEDRVAVGTPVANRNRLETEGLIGFFVNTLVLPIDLSADPPFGGLVARARETALTAYDHQDVPFEKLVEALAPERSLAHTPLYQVMLSLQRPWLGETDPAPDLGTDVHAGAHAGIDTEAPAGMARTDLTLTLREGSGPLAGSLNYNTDLFERETVLQFWESFEALLQAAVDDPQRPLSDLPLLSGTGRLAVARAPRPYPTPEAMTSYMPPNTPTEQKLAEIWAGLLGLERAGLHDNFFERGGHSLLAIRLMAQIRSRLGQEVPVTALFQHPTLEALARNLDERRASTASSTASSTGAPPIALEMQPKGTAKTATKGVKLPFFCVHPVGGGISCYAELARWMGPERPFLGLPAPPSADLKAFAGLEELAAHHLRALREFQPEGPYLLGGWSMGGLLALEMAHQLRDAGQRVELLCLFDPSPPRRTGNPPESEADLALGFARDLAGLYGVRLPADAADLKGQPAREGMEKLFGRWRKAGLVPEDLGFDDLWERFEVYRWNVAAVFRYTPRPYAGTIALFPAERPRGKGGGGPDLPAAWRPVAAATLEVLHIPGDHYTLLREPCVKALAHSLRSRLNRT